MLSSKTPVHTKGLVSAVDIIHGWWRVVSGLIVARVCAVFGRGNQQAQQYSSALQHSYNELKMDGCDKGSCNASVELHE